jgi:AraC-like DNA-binding protein
MKPFYEKVPLRESSSFYAYEKICANFEFSWHYHPEYEITAITRGRGKRYIADSICEYERLDIVMIPPDMPHSWHSEPQEGGSRAIVVQFSQSLLEDFGLRLPEMAAIKRLLDSSRGALDFGNDAAALAHMRNVAKTDGLESLLNLAALLRHLGLSEPAIITSASPQQYLKDRDDCQSVNRLFNYININYTRRITLAEAAGLVCRSESAFCRFFKQISGKRFIEHINDLRVAHACRLLRETDKPVTEICFEAGFANIANFNRQFSKRKKRSPRQYRSNLPKG